MFAVWFTNGDPTWFVMPTGTWENDSTYSGTLYAGSMGLVRIEF
jgi:hypothetical protein